MAPDGLQCPHDLVALDGTIGGDHYLEKQKLRSESEKKETQNILFCNQLILTSQIFCEKIFI